jgi:uncharacterized protein YbjT (DUF2867 family)
MTTKRKHDNPILVTGAAGAVGGIGRNLTKFLLARGHKVRALVRREDNRAEALRQLGADVVQGDLTDLASVHRAIDELALPFGAGKTSPISAVDVALAAAAILDDPAPHIGQIYDLTGPESADLDHYARAFSEALGRPIRYRDVPLAVWSEGLRRMRFPEHVVNHLSAMTELNRQGRYDRLTDTFYKLTGQAPTNMHDFVKLHAAEFESSGARPE